MKSFIHRCILALGLVAASFGAFGLSSARAETTSGTIAAARDMTLEEVHKLFRKMAGQSDIAFNFVEDGCYARAHLMIERMRRLGYEPVRVWTFASGESLHVKTTKTTKGYVEWNYHVAPAIPARIQGRTVMLVIDPSLFNRPVTVDEWVNVQKRTSASRPILQVTRIGEAVFNPTTRLRLGSGYWPGVDPPEGVTNAAIATMKRYKAMERS